MKPYLQYANDVQDGKIVTGKLIRLSVNRFFDFLDRDDLEFMGDKVDRVISFISLLKHYKGRHSGKSFVLEPWQQFIIANIYGFYYKESGNRLTQTVYIEMARKNGKSALAAALCLEALIADGESGAEVYLAANSKDQVKLSSWPLCSNFAKGLDPKGKFLDIYRDTIKFDATFSWLKVLAADSTKLDGPDAYLYLLDEYHAAKTSEVKNVLESSQTSRENPLGIIITTAGFDKLGPCYQFRQMCIEVLQGLKEDDTLFSAIYCLDEDDDWKDEKTWAKSNPNLGITVRIEKIKSEVRKAINAPSEEVPVRTKTINQWCDSSDTWIPDHYIMDASKKVNLDEFVGCDCYGGVDLSSTSDLTALSLMLIKGGFLYFKTFYYLPEEALKEKKYATLYGRWRHNKSITITPGNVCDYDYILKDLVTKTKDLNLISVGYDSWNATQFVVNAQDAYMPMQEYSQALGSFNRPTKEFERRCLSNKLIIDDNEITRFCFKNVVMKYDYNGNCKPSKESGDNKIDGVIAMLQALGIYLLTPHYDLSI
ncbi:terminase large subunit [Parabacteroides sp. Marseille-P3160]|uniref:terminase large subunit n=1 Tax=Parabacteroides sp. Marseille-P3160 TaxID=1917887 RepID=UPI0009B9F3B3|nr:terminase TerL endonuclease subunit [Parabacteroides sp. Marseille-P3160]